VSGWRGETLTIGKGNAVDIMWVLGWIVIGIVAGWLAGLITREQHSIWGDLVLGLLGALVAGLVVNGLGQANNFVLSIIAAAAGAVVLVVLRNLIGGRKAI
jgi:uncharacterized membrane protein YeaQ/YmgE (transglycosylase-associated protein family)